MGKQKKQRGGACAEMKCDGGRSVTPPPSSRTRTPPAAGEEAQAGVAKKAVKIHKPGPWKERPKDKGELAWWVKEQIGVHVVGAGLEYLCWAFFEGGRHEGTEAQRHDRKKEQEGGKTAESDGSALRAFVPDASVPSDCIVWACRGGGKTFLAAVATALDLIFKPGIQVRLIAGSVEQGQRMYEHLRRIFEHGRLMAAVKGRITERKVELLNGSAARLLAPSQASVRGTRINKVRVDEVDVIQQDVWKALQLTTVSKRCGDVEVRGSVECFSTMHEVGGLMSRLVDGGNRKVFKWGVIDVMGECEGWRACRGHGHISTALHRHIADGSQGSAGAIVSLPQLDGERRQGDCALWEDCRGVAKTPGRVGHVRVADAIADKSRVDAETWQAEMVCLRPRRTGRVFEEFQRECHVVGDKDTLSHLHIDTSVRGSSLSDVTMWPCDNVNMSEPPRLLCGMDFGWRSPTVVLWGELVGGKEGVLTIVDERVVKGAVMSEHVKAITGSAWGKPVWIGIDPAGSQKNDHTGTSNAQLLRDAGLEVKWRRVDVAPGLGLVRARLRPGDGSPPRLLVHERCRELIRSLESYRWDPALREMQPLKDGSDHAVDALRYLMVNLDGGEGTRRGAYVAM